MKTTVWKFLEDLLKNKIFWIVIAVLVIAYFIYQAGKKSISTINLPNNGDGIPEGWSPSPVAIQLHAAFEDGGYFGLGGATDEEAIWDALDGLTDDQLVAVYNEYNALYQAEDGEDLIQAFEAELSGDELDRALNYYLGLI